MNAKRSKKSQPLTEEAETPTEESVEAGVDSAETEAAVEEDIAEASAEVDGLHNRLLRLQADFDNYRRRTQRERLEISVMAQEELMLEILPLLDHFELGMKNAADHDANPMVVEGFQLVLDQMRSTLGRFGLTPIEAVGRPFDPHLHEAITHLPSEEYPPDMVAAETRRGYLLKDKLLRASQVVVSSGPGPADGGEEEG